MQELEKILEEINEEIKSSIAFSSVFTDGLCRARNIIINHLSRESTQEITRSSRDSQFGECSQREVYMKAYEDALNEDGVSEEFLEDCRRTAQKYKKDNDGWMSVEERMPEEYGEYLVTIVPSAGYLWAKRIIANFSDLMGIVKKPIFYTGEVGKIDFEDITDMVIAWSPIPEPYRPERNNDEKE